MMNDECHNLVGVPSTCDQYILDQGSDNYNFEIKIICGATYLPVDFCFS